MDRSVKLKANDAGHLQRGLSPEPTDLYTPRPGRIFASACRRVSTCSTCIINDLEDLPLSNGIQVPHGITRVFIYHRAVYAGHRELFPRPSQRLVLFLLLNCSARIDQLRGRFARVRASGDKVKTWLTKDARCHWLLTTVTGT